MFWLNADIPTRIWKLHREDCMYCKPRETHSKGVGVMNGYGGWFSFETVDEAYDFYLSQNERYVWQPCKVCRPEAANTRARTHFALTT
jgi:hypothetical protein